MITKLFLVLIASVIPIYFLLLFVTSAYHRLADLKRRCVQLLREVQQAKDPADLSRLRNEHAATVVRYNRARSTFPGALIGTLFRFPPTAPDADDTASTR